MVAVGALTGALQPLERALQDTGFSLREHDASGQIHIIEMDAASVAQIKRWPWPRGHYARVIDQLNVAGVRKIAFDIDLSTTSNPQQDAMLTAAFSRSRASIVLPVFGQNASFGSKRQLDSLPLERFRDHVLLGSVSIPPDSDGLVRRAPLGTFNAGVPRPSLAAQVAYISGIAGEHFPIDFSIRPETIPRHSFVEIENGQFDPADLAGKDVIIGATAIEMGDRFTVPTYGVLHGVVVQAIAAETLARGVPMQIGWPLMLFVAVFAATAILLAPSHAQVAARTVLAGTGVLGLWHLGSRFLPLQIEVVPALLVLMSASGLRIAILLHRAFRAGKMIDAESGMPNRKSLEQHIADRRGGLLVTAMIDEFDALKAVLADKDIASLLSRIEDRLLACGVIGPIHRIDDRVCAWITTLEIYELEDHLAGLGSVMRSPLEVGGRRVDVRLAFGVAKASAISGAVHAASVALRAGDVCAFHEDAAQAVLEGKLSLMGELDAAIARGELELLYQPKLELSCDRVTSAEALVRWHHPARGYMRPDSFIPMAEETGRIGELTLYVLHQAISDLRNFCTYGVEIRVAVNISARVISSSEFVGQIEQILKQGGVPAHRLIFEITESATLSDPETARTALLGFRDLGVDISMDDYGTGQSTLSYLKNLPLSELKIDRSFVQYAHQDRDDALMVRSTVELAHELGITVVAEGVEDEGCLAFLRSIGCDYAQGYHVGRPMHASDLITAVTDVRLMAG